MGGCLSSSSEEDKIQVIHIGADGKSEAPQPKPKVGAAGGGEAKQPANGSDTAAAANGASAPTSKPVVPSGPYKGGVGSNGKRNATLVILGLNNAGKSTIGNNIKGSPGDFVFPTMGFDLDEDIIAGNFNVKLFGLGGDEKIRGYWPNYYDDIHGIVFVVDSADTARIGEVRKAFSQVSSDHRVVGKPILVYANKQDLPGALTDSEIAAQIGLTELTSSPHHIIKCVALVDPEKEDESAEDKAKRRPPDPAIPRGLNWLLTTIDTDFRTLNERVERDLAARKIANAKQAEDKRRQVDAWRKEEEEKERRAAEEKEKAAAAAEQAAATAERERINAARAQMKREREEANGGVSAAAGTTAATAAASIVTDAQPAASTAAPAQDAAGASASASAGPLPNSVGN